MFKDAISLIQSILFAAALASMGMQSVSAAPEATFILEFSIGNQMFLESQPAAPTMGVSVLGDGAVRTGSSVRRAGAAAVPEKSAGAGDFGGAGHVGAPGADGDLDGDGDQFGPPVAGPVSSAAVALVGVSARHAPVPQCVMVPLVPPPRHLPS